MRFVYLLSAVHGAFTSVEHHAVGALRPDQTSFSFEDEKSIWDEAVGILYSLLSRVTDARDEKPEPGSDGTVKVFQGDVATELSSVTTADPTEFTFIQEPSPHMDPRSGSDLSSSSQRSGTIERADASADLTAKRAKSGDIQLTFAHLKPYDGVTTGTPMPFFISRRCYESLGPQMGPLFRKRVEKDSAYNKSLPLLEFDTELVPSAGGGLLPLKLERLMARSFEGTIATVVGRPDLILKYQSNCDNLREVHPLVRDYLSLSAVADLGITPQPFFLSPPTKFTALITPKTRFQMPEPFRRDCVASAESAVRYMVMEKVGITISDLIHRHAVKKTVIPLQIVVTAMTHALVGIQAIHERGIVHGDVHAGNLVILERNGDQTIGFIDFGHSFFLSETRPAMTYRPMREAHCLFSHWNTEGYRFGMRDDVYKILMAGAYMMNGPIWLEYCQGLETDAERMVQWKRNQNIFRVPGRYDFLNYLGHLSVEEQGSIIQNLTKALDLARSVEGLDDVPPYDLIISELNSVWHLLQAHS